MVYVYQDTVDAGERIIRKRDAELSNERDQANAVVTSIGEGILVLNKNHRVISMNPVAERLLNIPLEKATKKEVTSVLTLYRSTSKLNSSDHPALRSLNGKSAVRIDLKDKLTCRPADAEAFPVSIVVTPFSEDGIVNGAVVVFRDSSNEKAAASIIQQKVKEGRAQLLASINSLELGYIMTHQSSSIALVNSAALTILRKIRTNQKHNSTINLDELQKALGKEVDISKHIELCIKERQSITLPDQQYDRVFIKIFISPIVLNNEAIGTVVLIQDITEEKVLERSRDEFFAIASHELRTPVAIIRCYLDSLSSNHPTLVDNADIAAKMKILRQTSDRLKTIINDFLDLSRLEQGRIAFQEESFDITSIVGSVVEDSILMARNKKLELRAIKETSKIGKVIADPERVKQVLLNLVGNAIKFTERGQIIIHIRPHNTNEVLVEVEDSGIGIPTENQSLLFHKFQQAGDSFITRDVSGGTGLGLYISKLMIEQMGGRIYLEASIVGKGSIFAFTLPCEKE